MMECSPMPGHRSVNEMIISERIYNMQINLQKNAEILKKEITDHIDKEIERFKTETEFKKEAE